MLYTGIGVNKLQFPISYSSIKEVSHMSEGKGQGSYGGHGMGSFAFIVVLFILLIIVGASFVY